MSFISACSGIHAAKLKKRGQPPAEPTEETQITETTSQLSTSRVKAIQIPFLRTPFCAVQTQKVAFSQFAANSDSIISSRSRLPFSPF